MARRFFNNTTGTGTIAAAGAGDLTFTATAFTNTPTTPFTAVVDRGLVTEEIVLVTGVAGSTLTVTRGYDGTSGSSHGGGAVIEHVIAAEGPNRWDAHAEATSDVHGVTGALVGAASTQTITNKTNQASVYEGQGTTSPGTGPLHKARVDTTTRTGFVADTTGTAAAGRAFSAQQSGVDRWYVNADGSTITNPSGSPTWAEDCTGNSRVTGAETVTGTITAGGLTTSGTVAAGPVTGTNITASGTAQQATSTTTGNATVGGTLGVTGATTLGTVTAGAVGVSSLAASGDVTARNAATFTELLESNAHGAWSTKIRVADTTVHNRSSRQPVVHRIAASGLSAAVAGSETQLYTITLTNKEQCNHAYNLMVGCFVDAGGGSGTEPFEAFLRLRVRDGSDVIKYDSGQIFRISGNEYYPFGNQRNQPRTPIIAADTTLWNAGSTYKVQIYGQKQTTLAAVLDMINGFVQEVVVAT